MTRRLTSVGSALAPREDAGDGPPLVVLIGPPGSGKGTQGERLGEQFGLGHLSAGDALRDAVSRGTLLGEHARECFDAGRLVPDELVSDVVAESIARVCESARLLLC